MVKKIFLHVLPLNPGKQSGDINRCERTENLFYGG